MSTLWTPGGEHPVDRNRPAQASTTSQPAAGPEADAGGWEGPEPSAEELKAAREAVQRMASVPVAVMLAQHAIDLFNLAQVHLSVQPPNLPEAALAIDAMAALVEGLKGRLGADEVTLLEALSAIRIAFVQVKAAVDGGAFDGG